MIECVRILRVAVPSPLYRCFDYLPASDPAPISPGCRVRVPFGPRREVVGVVLGEASESELPRSRLKHVATVLDETPLLAAGLLDLLCWAADYYHHPIGDVIHTALPVPLRQGRPLGSVASARWVLTAAGRAADSDTLVRAPLQRRLLGALTRQAEGLDVTELKDVSRGWRSAVRILESKGLVVRRQIDDCVQRPVDRPVPAPALTAAQRRAADAIVAHSGRYRAFLIHGVTGSGKTEVYLAAIRGFLAQGRNALVLVPEIGLTPQFVRRFIERLGIPVTVLHSGLTDQERLRGWARARAGHAPIVLGTRSAVFTPIPRLGLIVLDEEHDSSYKQQEGFRYSARDVAVKRAAAEDIPIVLGSATPSLESIYNAKRGSYALLSLPERPGAARMPSIGLIDMRRTPARDGLSPQLVEQIGLRLAAGEQSLLFLNRRGFSPVWMCHDCGWLAPCRRCDAKLTFHNASRRLRCHHCGAEADLFKTCPACHGENLHPLGQGTERVEAALARLFPQARIVRIDRDSTRRRGSLEEMLRRIHAGEADILVGTQMLSKGHDFPAVTLVGVLNADQGLYSVDFRAAERLFQQVMQVSGRAGRAHRPGAALIQTWHPDHPVFTALRRHDYGAFAEFALAERSEAAYPPYCFLALLRAESPVRAVALGFLEDARKLAAGSRQAGDVSIFDPVPAPMERRAGRYRAQLLVQSANRASLQRFLTGWVPRVAESTAAKRVRWSVDVDPLDLY